MPDENTRTHGKKVKPKAEVAVVDYEYQKVFIRPVLTHAEYDKQNWKNDEGFGES